MLHLRDFVTLTGAPKPREYLMAAEQRALNLRKLLSDYESTRGLSRSSRPATDAIELAHLIEQLARQGYKGSAEQAMELAARVEVLIDALADEIHFLLAARNQRVDED